MNSFILSDSIPHGIYFYKPFWLKLLYMNTIMLFIQGIKKKEKEDTAKNVLKWIAN